MGQHALLFEDADARNGRRARQRVARIRQPAGEHPLVEVVGDRAGDHDTAEGDVTRVDTLGEGDQVGLGVPVLPGEPLPGAAETGHHLVGDPHDAELVADRPQPVEVAGRRHEDAVRADDRFEHDGCDLVGAFHHDGVAQVGERPLGFLFGRVRVERRPIRIRPPELHQARHRRLVLEPSRFSREADRECRASVVAAVCRQHLHPAGVALCETNRVLDAFGAGVGEEHLLEVASRAIPVGLLDDQSSSLAALIVGKRRRHHAQRVDLILDRLDHLRVLMPEVHVDEHRREIDPLAAGLIPELRAACTGDHRGVQRPLRGPRMEDPGAVVGVGVAHQS